VLKVNFLVKFYLSVSLPVANFQAYSPDLFLEKSPGTEKKNGQNKTFQNALDQRNVSDTAKAVLSPVIRCSFENICAVS